MDNPWIFAGGAAAMGLLATCWEYVKSIYQQVSGRLIVRMTATGYQSDAFLLLLNEEFIASRYGPRAYVGWMLHVRPRHRTQLVTMEVIGPGGRLYWNGWRPIWVAKSSQGDLEIEEGVNGRDEFTSNSLRVTFLRGLFQPDTLMLRACARYNDLVTAAPDSSRQRHYIRHIHGTAGKQLQRTMRRGFEPPRTSGDTQACLHHRPLGWRAADLGVNSSTGRSPLDDLALSAETLALVREARFWHAHEDWYRQRSIPWRRGWLLYGEPGTGKTALIRAVAEDLDLPVFVYDLASLRNEELQSAWSQMLCEVPCMAVIEDIDAVFHGRSNIVSRDQGLTFDCLLNCLDGIERSNGLFLTVTTNRLECVDQALGRPDDQNRSTRPGRIDRTLHLGALTEMARQTMAAQILPDRSELHRELVDHGDGDTAAQFQERCAAVALRQLWRDHTSDRPGVARRAEVTVAD